MHGVFLFLFFTSFGQEDGVLQSRCHLASVSDRLVTVYKRTDSSRGEKMSTPDTRVLRAGGSTAGRHHRPFPGRLSAGALSPAF